jgi:UDP-glucose 4-epimerase
MNNSFAGLEVLVAGGLGFVGSNLAIRLVELGAKVTIVDALVPDHGGNLFNIESIRDRITLSTSDVRDTRTLEALVRGKQYLFNLVGQVSHIDSMVDPYTDMEINVLSQLCILETCRKCNQDIKIVYAGTRQIYGKPEYLPVDEKHPIHPTDVNGIDKMAGEWYHILYNNVHGIRTCSLRLTNTYGPRQLIRHNRQGFVGWFIRQIVEGSEIKIYGDGTQIRDFNYVGDVVDAMLLAAEKEKANGQVFNLGGDQPISHKNLVELLIKIRGKGKYTLVPFPEEKKKIDIGDFCGDFSKIKGMLGWKPNITLEDGLEKTILYYLTNSRHYVD